MSKIEIKRPWFNQDVFFKSMVGVKDMSKYSVSQGKVSSKSAYSEEDSPLLPCYTTSMIVGKKIRITGLDTQSQLVKEKLQKLKNGEATDILFFSIPANIDA